MTLVVSVSLVGLLFDVPVHRAAHVEKSRERDEETSGRGDDELVHQDDAGDETGGGDHDEHNDSVLHGAYDQPDAVICQQTCEIAER